MILLDLKLTNFSTQKNCVKNVEKKVHSNEEQNYKYNFRPIYYFPVSSQYSLIRTLYTKAMKFWYDFHASLRV